MWATESNTESPVWQNVSRGTNQRPDVRWTMLDHFHHRNEHLVLIGIDMDLSFLDVMFLPKLLPIDLKNSLSTVLVFHTALLLTKKFISLPKN